MTTSLCCSGGDEGPPFTAALRAGGGRRIAGDLLYDNYLDWHREERSRGALDAISRRPTPRADKKNHCFYTDLFLSSPGNLQGDWLSFSERSRNLN